MALLDYSSTHKMALQGKIAKQRTILDLKMNGMDFKGWKAIKNLSTCSKERKWMITNKEQLRILYYSNQDVKTSETRTIKNSFLITSLAENILE